MFTIQQWKINAAQNAVVFHYACDEYGAFQEQITFPSNTKISEYEDDKSFCTYLNIAAAYLGVSYYKLSASHRIIFEPPLGTPAQKSVMALYGEGLGEFYIRNALVYPPQIDFNFTDAKIPPLSAVASNNKATLAFGGGKDSHVSIGLLEKKNIEFELLSVVLSPKVEDTLDALSTHPMTYIHRRLDGNLIALGRAGRGYNGHIPITAINSILLTLYSYMAGNKWVIFSNERGASIPTMHHDGHAVNHQFSKSFQFEKLFRGALAGVSDIEYFSILRPFSELWIAEQMAQNTKGAHAVFSSCNRNFVFDVNKPPQENRWCGECSKCVYTALILAPHLSVVEFKNIFGGNILNEEKNIQTAMDLCGIGTAKPWECVGDFVDTASALYTLSTLPEWRESEIPKALKSALEEKYGAEILRQRFESEIASRSENFLPEEFQSLLG